MSGPLSPLISSAGPKGWTRTKLKHVARLEYGSALAAEVRVDGPALVYGSNGPVGTHTKANTQGATIILGRKGSFGKVSYSPEPCFCIDTAFFIDRRSSKAHLRWLYFLLQTLGLDTVSQDTGVPGLAREAAHDAVIWCPSVGDQRAIADFLDRKTAAIDALIEKKERLCVLLAEKRHALTGNAVTRGLDASISVKDSNAEWVGEVPRHWRVLPIKRLAREGARTFTDGDWIETPFITGTGVRLIQTGNVGIGIYKDQGFRYVSEATFSSLRCTEVKPGNVLICRLDGPVGRACLVPDLGVRMITSVDNAILKVAPENDARYIVQLLSMPEYLEWVKALCRVGGGFRFRISRSMLGDFRVPVPPKQEQVAIADRLDELTKPILEAERCLEESQTRLREYRQALITAAVTGQLDPSKESPT